MMINKQECVTDALHLATALKDNVTQVGCVVAYRFLLKEESICFCDVIFWGRTKPNSLKKK